MQFIFAWLTRYIYGKIFFKSLAALFTNKKNAKNIIIDLRRADLILTPRIRFNNIPTGSKHNFINQSGNLFVAPTKISSKEFETGNTI